MLYLIGLGLDWKDLSLKALEAINRCDMIYLDGYTSVVQFSVLQLERLLGKKIKVLDRKAVEETKPFLKDAAINDVALLVHGSPLIATTHIAILQECAKKKIRVEVIHAPSILEAAAETGLQIYKFGKVASVPFWEKSYKPESFFDILEQNQSIGAHTLFLLDLRPEKNQFLTIRKAIAQLLEIARKRKSSIFDAETLCVGCARLGCKDKSIVAGKAQELAKKNFGKPPYCLIVPAKLHFKEEEFLNLHAPSNFE